MKLFVNSREFNAILKVLFLLILRVFKRYFAHCIGFVLFIGS